MELHAIKDFFLRSSSKKQFFAFVLLFILILLSFAHPVVFKDTINLDLYSAIPLVFWLALSFGLLIPFVTSWVHSKKATLLWGTTIFSFFWSYFTIVEPELRYPDSYVHSLSSLTLTTQGANPQIIQYLFWPQSFILQDVVSSVTGLSLLTISRILAVLIVALIGLALMLFFSQFFRERKSVLLCLYALFLSPNTLMLTTTHYAPQLLSYLFVLLIVLLIYQYSKRSFGLNRQVLIVLMVLLIAVVLSNPTTTIWLMPILASMWLFNIVVNKTGGFVFSSFLFLFFISFTAAWWIQPNGLVITNNLLDSLIQKLHDVFATSNLALNEGVFRPSYQPLFSLLIRRVTFAFIGIMLIPAGFALFNRTCKSVKQKRNRLKRVDSFFLAVTFGSLISTVLLWVGTGGSFGDRSLGILTPLLAVLVIESVILINRKIGNKIVLFLLPLLIILLVPLNFVATNYSEALLQTSPSEASGIQFVSYQDFHDQFVFSDNSYTLGRFSYAFSNSSNTLFFRSSLLLEPIVAGNATLLVNVTSVWDLYKNWTIFIHNENTPLLMYARYGVAIENPDISGIQGINKFYDNGQLKMYNRVSSG